MLKICRYCQLGSIYKIQFQTIKYICFTPCSPGCQSVPRISWRISGKEGEDSKGAGNQIHGSQAPCSDHSSHSGPLQDISPQSVNSIISVVKARKLGINLDVSFLHPITSKHSQLAFINLSLLHNQFLSLPPFQINRPSCSS